MKASHYLSLIFCGDWENVTVTNGCSAYQSDAACCEISLNLATLMICFKVSWPTGQDNRSILCCGHPGISHQKSIHASK